MVGLNSENIDTYRNAVSLLSREQANLLLSSNELNQAQIDLILSNKKVTASEVVEAVATTSIVKTKVLLTTEQQKQLISSSAITSEKLAEVAATLGLETAESGALVAKKALNVETVKQQLTSMGIVGATQAQIVSMLGLTTAETGAVTAGNVLTGVMTRLNLAISTNPIGALVTVIGLAITAAWGLSKAFDALTDSAEEIDERVDSLIEKYNEAKKSADENASTVESLASEYEKLSKGVNNLGENVSLTSDEYDRYNQIVNQIADMFPGLISGYTEEGNAILSLKGNVESLRDAYKEAQQEAYNLLVAKGEDSDGNDIVKAYKNLSELDFWDKDNVIGADDFTTTAKRDVTKQILNLMQDLETAPEEYDKLAKEIFDKYGDRGYNLLEEMGLPAIKDAFTDSTDITEDALKSARATVQAYYQGYESEIKNKLGNMNTFANAFLLTNEDYSKLNKQSQTAASLIVNNLTEDIANGFSSKEDVGAYVANIVSQLKDNKDLDKAIVGLFTTDLSNLSVDDAKTVVDKYINIIAEAFKESPVELKARLGFSDYDDAKPLKTKVQGFLKDEYDNRVGELTLEDLDIASKLDIPEGTLLSWDELIEKIKEVKEQNANFKVDELSKKIDEIQNAYKTLRDAIKEYNKEGYISVDTFQSIMALSPEYLKYLVDENGNLRLNEQALKDVAIARIQDMVVAQKIAVLDTAKTWTDEADALKYLKGNLDDASKSKEEFLNKQLKEVQLKWVEQTDENGNRKFSDKDIQENTKGILSVWSDIDTLGNSAINGINNGLGMTGESAKDVAKNIKDINKQLDDLAKSEVKYKFDVIRC